MKIFALVISFVAYSWAMNPPLTKEELAAKNVAVLVYGFSKKDNQTKVLLGSSAYSGRWTIPGGIIDPGDTARKAAARELFEETAAFPEFSQNKTESMIEATPENRKFLYDKQTIIYVLPITDNIDTYDIKNNWEKRVEKEKKSFKEVSDWKWMPITDLLTSLQKDGAMNNTYNLKDYSFKSLKEFHEKVGLNTLQNMDGLLQKEFITFSKSVDRKTLKEELNLVDFVAYLTKQVYSENDKTKKQFLQQMLYHLLATGGPWGIAEREASPLEMLVLEKGLSVSNFQQADETKNLLKSSSNKAISKQQEAIAFLKRQKEEVPEKIQLNLSKTVFDQIFPYLLEQPKPKENQKVLYLNDVQIAAFLLGFVKDSYGRSIQDILNFSLQEKEEEHCYIQWLFPNFSQGVCPKAPLLSATLAKALREQLGAQFMLKSIQESLQKSLESMIKFYGGQLKTSFDYETFDITKAKDYDERVKNFKTNRHNERRITRILLCLKFFGLDSLAKNFYDYMTTDDMEVKENTKKYWLDALNRTISYKNFGKNS